MMKKKFLQMSAILTAVLTLTACNLTGTGNNNNNTNPSGPVNNGEISTQTVNLCEGKGGNEVQIVVPGDTETKALSSASVKLLSELMKGNKEGNVLISPASIDFALGMTENGAANNTLKQMEQTVNGGIGYEQMNGIMAYSSEKMENNTDVNWNVANSVWFRDNGMWDMNDDFLNNVVDYYHSEIYKAPFDTQTLNDINNWVKKETHEMIPEILSDIPDDAQMYLINAIAFEGEWAEKYEEEAIREGMDFTNIDNSISEVNMLCSSENRYFKLAGGQGFVKPYEGYEYSFVGILPEEGQTPAEYLDKLAASGEDFSEAVRNAAYKDVYVRIPEFDLDYDIELSDAYAAMGMDEPFDPEKADFTKMMSPAFEGDFAIWIGRIIHKTHIEVDRKGTKAAAATAVEMDVAGCAPMDEQEIYYVYLDRPFVYAIVDNETGLPIFIGCQNTMQ